MKPAQKKFIKIAPSGFTLVELLIVIAIIALVMAISIPTFRNFSRYQELKVEAEKIVSHLEYAQNKAQSGQRSTTGGDLGYYIDFSDFVANNTYYLKRHHIDTPYSTTEEEYKLDEGIVHMINFDVYPVIAETAVRVFYYDIPHGQFSCLNAPPATAQVPVPCNVSSGKFRLTLSNTHTEKYYVYIDKGGVIYESQN